MPFFQRNKGPQIPPVQSEKPDPYAGGGGAYQSDPYAARGVANGRSGGGDPYANGHANANGRSGVHSDPYAQAKSNSNATSNDGWGASGNPYARQAPAANQEARSELFAGYTAPEAPKPQRQYGYEGREQEEDFDEEEEVEGIRQEMRGVKQESLASTR